MKINITSAANPTRPESSDLRADKEDERLAITAAGVSAGIYGLSEWQKACYHNSCSTWYCPNWICSAGRIDKGSTLNILSCRGDLPKCKSNAKTEATTQKLKLKSF